MLDKILDFIILKIFGKYSLSGFEKSEKEIQRVHKDKYIFESIFPDDEIAKCQLEIIENKNEIII